MLNIIKEDLRQIVSYFFDEIEYLPPNLTDDEYLAVKKAIIEELERLGDIQVNRDKLYDNILRTLHE